MVDNLTALFFFSGKNLVPIFNNGRKTMNEIFSQATKLTRFIYQIVIRQNGIL